MGIYVATCVVHMHVSIYVSIMHIGQRKIIQLICVWSVDAYFYSKICTIRTIAFVTSLTIQRKKRKPLV